MGLLTSVDGIGRIGVSGIRTGSGTSAAVIVAGIEVKVCGESNGLEEENRVIGW